MALLPSAVFLVLGLVLSSLLVYFLLSPALAVLSAALILHARASSPLFICVMAFSVVSAVLDSVSVFSSSKLGVRLG